MSDSTSTAQGAGTAQAGGSQSAGGSQTFTQEQVNSMVAAERREVEAKYKGFSEYKAAAEEYAQLKESQKSELQKVQDDLAAVTKERDELKSAAERSAWVSEVAEQTKVPASTVAMLSGKTKEELVEQAKRLAPDFAEAVGSEGGKPASTGPDAKGDFINALFG